jgi:hypothetical protein
MLSPNTFEPGKLHLVGESHAESDARRDTEKRFCRAVTGSANYWEEADFPVSTDIVRSGGRKTRTAPDAAPGVEFGADLMEYRAVHGAALLIDQFQKMAAAARLVARTAIPPGKAEATENAAIAGFLTGEFRQLVLFRDRVRGTWQPTGTGPLNEATEAVYTTVQAAHRAFDRAVREGKTGEKVVAAGELAQKEAAVVACLPALAEAVGAPDQYRGSATQLADFMRYQRSSFMGLAAGFSKEIGVWKVGQLHVEDLLTGPSKVDLSRIRILTQKQFNDALQAWGR